MATDAHNPPGDVYFREIDLENFEDYTVGVYHPTIIGDTFRDGRYEVVHKLGFGGYSTIWLARDRLLQRYVSLKILVANESSETVEGVILRLLSDPNSTHPGRLFIPRLLDEFAFDGPNGHHVCLVQEPAVCSIATSKDHSSDFMFPVETARSIAAQLILGLLYLHSRGVCHGDLHIQNMLLCGPNLDRFTPEELYERYRLWKTPVRRVDGAAVEPHAPTYAVYPMRIKTPADKLVDPVIRISDYGTSFVVASEPSPQLHTPALYLPPEAFFDEPITLAADIWTLGVNLYEVLGERPLFETFSWDRDDILADMINTLGRPPQRWWERWAGRAEFFEQDGSWNRGGVNRIYSPVFRPLRQRLWEMGRGETPETCQWDVESGEMRALEELLRGMLAFEPAERLTAEDLVKSEYMVKWAMPAWERQCGRQARVHDTYLFMEQSTLSLPRSRSDDIIT